MIRHSLRLVELNCRSATGPCGTWIHESSDCGTVHLVDFQPTGTGWVVRQGFTDALTVRSLDFKGWDPEFEAAIGGHRHCSTREELDDELQDLGIMPGR